MNSESALLKQFLGSFNVPLGIEIAEQFVSFANDLERNGDPRRKTFLNALQKAASAKLERDPHTNDLNRIGLVGRALYIERILGTRPVPVNSQSKIQIHLLTCERDHLEALWCIKSWAWATRSSFSLMIHDDGSLSRLAINRLRTHLPGLTIIPRKKADLEVGQFLRAYPGLNKLRSSHVLFLKFFDPFFYAKTDFYFVLDSDVLFFKKPRRLLEYLDTKTPFHMDGLSDYYCFSRKEIWKNFRIRVISKYNSGIASFSKDIFDWDLISRFARSYSSKKEKPEYWGEQTLYAILSSKNGVPRSKCLPSPFSISVYPHAQCQANHYVGGFARTFYFIKAMPELLATQKVRKIPENKFYDFSELTGFFE